MLELAKFWEYTTWRENNMHIYAHTKGCHMNHSYRGTNMIACHGRPMYEPNLCKIETFIST